MLQAHPKVTQRPGNLYNMHLCPPKEQVIRLEQNYPPLPALQVLQLSRS